jgi:MOSC domain-containing protein YiiM
MSLAVGKIEAVHVGPVQYYTAPAGATASDGPRGEWVSGIQKLPISGAVMVRTNGLDGDGQADLVVHGGPDGAVMAYAAAHYPLWEKQIGRPLAFGSFGENLTVTGFDDSTVCLGDVWAVGDEVLLQVTQPRQPCYKLARRLGEPRIIKWITEQCNGGWYFRVLREGRVASGMPIRQVEQGLRQWPVNEAVRVMYARAREPDAARRLGDAEPLSSRWKQALADV